MEASNTSLSASQQAQLGAEIVARIEAGDRAKTKADDHHLAAGLRLIEARDRVEDFSAFLRKHCRGLKRSRAYELIRIAGGRTTVEAVRARTAERVRKHREAKASPLRNGQGSGETVQLKKQSPEWLLGELRFFIARHFPKMDAATLAKAKAMVAGWSPATIEKAA